MPIASDYTNDKLIDKMKTTIEIDCEDKRELIMHLEIIKEQVEATSEDEIACSDPYEIEDCNCYGTHYATIEQ